MRTAVLKKLCGKKRGAKLAHNMSSMPTSTTGTLMTLRATMQRKISGMLHSGKSSVYEMAQPRKESAISTTCSVSPLQVQLSWFEAALYTHAWPVTKSVNIVCSLLYFLCLLPFYLRRLCLASQSDDVENAH